MQPADVPSVLANRFRVESIVGTGGMGAVYVATDLSIGRRVAIKMLHPELAAQPDHLERLREEAFSLASLHHPNIVQLFDFHAGGPEATFMVMELVEGETLAERLTRHPMLPIDMAVDYALQLLSALSAAHARGIVHRDVKPANLLVMSVPARRDLIKVLDFGIAKLTEETIRRRPTTAGILLGTPTYMSPEQASGRPVDPRTDVHAVGLVLYRMLSGSNPFEGYDLATTLHRVQSFVPPALTQLRADAPPHLAHAIARAVSKDPAARFGSALDFAQSLGGSYAASLEVRGPSAAAPVLHALARVDPGTLALPPNHAPMVIDQRSGAIHVPPGQPGARTLASATSSGAAAAPPKGIFLIGIGVGFVVMLLVGLTGTVVWLVSKQSPDATSAPDAALAPVSTIAATPVASVSTKAVTSASAPAPSIPTPVKPTPLKEFGGACSCLPHQATSAHGNNMKLAPKARHPRSCTCTAASGASLCPMPLVAGDCPDRRFTSTLGAPCAGIDSNGDSHTSTVKSCQFDNVNVYAGPRGRPCKGFTVEGNLVEGDVFCPNER